jgi:hypothetical protein
LVAPQPTAAQVAGSRHRNREIAVVANRLVALLTGLCR